MPCPAEKVWSGKAMQPEATGALRRMGQVTCPFLLLKPASRSLKFNQPTAWLRPQRGLSRRRLLWRGCEHIANVDFAAS